MSAWFADFIVIVLFCLIVAMPTRVLGNALGRHK